MIDLAKICDYCGCNFQNWVPSKIMHHIGKHSEKGDKLID